jgi:hypothetical protein
MVSPLREAEESFQHQLLGSARPFPGRALGQIPRTHLNPTSKPNPLYQGPFPKPVSAFQKRPIRGPAPGASSNKNWLNREVWVILPGEGEKGQKKPLPFA